MSHAMIYEAVRTPRGKGKKDGSLHEVKPVDLLAGLLVKLQQRLTSTRRARRRGDGRGLADRRAGLGDRQDGGAESRLGLPRCRHADQPLLRLGPGAVNLAAQKVASGWEDLVVAGGGRACRACRSAVTAAPGRRTRTNFATGFVPQGIGADLIATLGGWGRDDVDRSRSRAAARAAQAEGRFDRSVVRWTTRSACRCSTRRIHQAAHHAGRPGAAEAGLRRDGRDGLRCGGAGALSAGGAHRARAPRRQRPRASSTARRRC